MSMYGGTGLATAGPGDFFRRGDRDLLAGGDQRRRLADLLERGVRPLGAKEVGPGLSRHAERLELGAPEQLSRRAHAVRGMRGGPLGRSGAPDLDVVLEPKQPQPAAMLGALRPMEGGREEAHVRRNLRGREALAVLPARAKMGCRGRGGGRGRGVTCSSALW